MVVHALVREQIGMAALFDYPASEDDEDATGIGNSGQAVGNNKRMKGNKLPRPNNRNNAPYLNNKNNAPCPC
jgi:hypothetical protein